MNMYYMNFVTSCFQVVIGMVLSPLALRLQYLGMSTAPTEDMIAPFQQLLAGFACMSGIDSNDRDRCQVRFSAEGEGEGEGKGEQEQEQEQE